MKKKMTRSDFETIIIEKFNSAKEVIATNHVEKEKFVTCYDSIAAGVRTENFYCQTCGHIESKPRVGYYHSSSYVCPSCGNDHITSRRNVDGRERRIYAKTNDNGFEGCLFTVSYVFPDGDENIDGTPGTPWYKMEPEMYVHVRYAFIFDNDYGWFFHDGTKMLKRGCQKECDYLAEVYRLHPIATCCIATNDWDDMLVQAKSFETKREAAASTRKANSKGNLIEEMRANYRAQNIDESLIMEGTHTFLQYVYDQNENGTVYKTVCTKCGHEFLINSHRNSDEMAHYQCPNCGMQKDEATRAYYSGSSSECHDVVVYENTNLPENDLLIRIFRVYHEFDTTKPLSSKVLEYQRIFCGKKVTVYGDHSAYSSKATYNMKKVTIRDICGAVTGWRVDGRCIQSNDEIRDIIRNSCLMYSGAVEAFGIGDSRYNAVVALPDMKYIMAWYKNPSIELLTKANMTQIASHMMDYPDHMHAGKNIAEVLGVPPYVAKIAIKENLRYEDMVALTALYNTDNTITFDTYQDVKNAGISTHHLISLKHTYNVPYTKALQYFEAVYNHQCIEKREAATLWIDYLKMASDLKMDLNDKSRMFPGSLKKEHDVAMFAHRAIQIELDKEQFAKQAEINSFFEYSYKDLIVVVPRTPQEIVEEATRQKNCLRSYVERVKRGDTVVVFIRRKNMPDSTYITAEVNNGTLTQLKGYCNSNPRNREIIEFVSHWAKAKGINVIL